MFHLDLTMGRPMCLGTRGVRLWPQQLKITEVIFSTKSLIKGEKVKYLWLRQQVKCSIAIVWTYSWERTDQRVEYPILKSFRLNAGLYVLLDDPLARPCAFWSWERSFDLSWRALSGVAGRYGPLSKIGHRMTRTFNFAMMWIEFNQKIDMKSGTETVLHAMNL